MTTANSLPTPTPSTGRKPRFGTPWRIAGAILLVLLIAVGAGPVLQGGAPPPTATRTPRASDLAAPGELQPIAQARVRSLAGGVVVSVAVEVGQTVTKEQEVA